MHLRGKGFHIPEAGTCMQGSLLQARVFLHPVVAHSWRRVTYLQLITRVHRIEGADDGIDYEGYNSEFAGDEEKVAPAAPQRCSP